VPSRNLVYEAIVLRARESPAGDRIVSLMTAEAGIVDAFVFGGPKSRLRSLSSPYAMGRAFVYLDPVKDFRKLSDFEVRECFPGIREDLDRLWAAGLMAELLLKTSGGGGEFPLVLALTSDALGALDCADKRAAEYPLLVFLWRFLGLIGLAPETGVCVRCSSGLTAHEREAAASRREDAASRGYGRPALYSYAEEGFLCPDCSGRAPWVGLPSASGGESCEEEGGLEVSAGAIRWLERAEALPFREALRARVDEASLRGLKAILYYLARKAADSDLASLSLAGLQP
jgi:DNA repair protein RecO (recombination protein O)